MIHIHKNNARSVLERLLEIARKQAMPDRFVRSIERNLETDTFGAEALMVALWADGMGLIDMNDEIKSQLATYKTAVHRGNPTAQKYVKHVELLVEEIAKLRDLL